MTGSDIILELQVTGESPAVLPFEVVGIAPADDSELIETVSSVNSPPEQRTSLFRGRALTHAIEAGWAVFEGDILLGRADELPAAERKDSKGAREAVAITGTVYRWPGGIIPYTIDNTMPNQARITSAIAHWNTAMAGYVNLVPRTTERDFVNFFPAPSASTCSSYVGRTWYEQRVHVGAYCSTGNMIHEIGHAVGLWHEQTREDRDGFVKILWENISAGTEGNFYQNIAMGDDIGLYDYGSIMHYAASSFSKNGLATIQTIPAGIAIGQRNGLNAGDIAAVRTLYPPPVAQPPLLSTVTIASNPPGMPVTIDGVARITPVTVDWVPGSAHTIHALDPQITGGVRNTFARWSDSGAPNHTIVVPTSASTYRADYVTSYSLAATAVPVGAIAASPASADTFYPWGAIVSLSATAPAGYCFTSWTGFLAGTPNSTSVVMGRSYTVHANFQLGAVTVSPARTTIPSTGGTVSISVTGNTGCAWSSSSAAAWASITAGNAGSGSGTATISIAANTTAIARSTTITIAGQPVTVDQSAGGSGVTFAITPATRSLLFGQAVTLWPVISGTYDKRTEWSSPALGTMSTATTAQTTYTYSTSPAGTQSNIVTITAVSLADRTKTATAVLTLVPPRVKLTLSDSAYLQAGSFRYVTAAVYDTGGPAYAGVTWHLSPAIGVLDTVKGTYTAPAVVAANTEVRLTATSIVDPRQSSTVVLYLRP